MVSGVAHEALSVLCSATNNRAKVGRPPVEGARCILTTPSAQVVDCNFYEFSGVHEEDKICVWSILQHINHLCKIQETKKDSGQRLVSEAPSGGQTLGVEPCNNPHASLRQAIR